MLNMGMITSIVIFVFRVSLRAQPHHNQLANWAALISNGGSSIGTSMAAQTICEEPQQILHYRRYQLHVGEDSTAAN